MCRVACFTPNQGEKLQQLRTPKSLAEVAAAAATAAIALHS
jgi:hypothetical protein